MRKVWQPSEFQEISLAEFCERVGWRTTAPTPDRARRDIIDALATVAWFRFLQSKWPDSTPYAVGQRVEPEGYSVNEFGEHSHSNKWAKYARGLHVPNKVLVNKAEHLVPGSSRVLNSALWQVLRRSPSSAQAVTLPEAMLGHEAQRVVARWRAPSNTTIGCAPGGFGRNLESLASLDALAVMVLWCQAAQLLGDSDSASDWVYRIYKMLLLLGGDLYTLGIARPLFELLQARVLRDVARAGWRYHFPAELYTSAIEYMFDAAQQAKGTPFPLLTSKQRTRRLQQVIEGRFGKDCMFALNPVRQPVGSADVITELDLRNCEIERRGFEWAWSLRREGIVHTGYPPMHVLLGTEAPTE